MNAAERKIADFLDSVGIKYVYENPMLIEQEFSNKKFMRIYYPDFFLSQYGVIIEFWGMHEHEEYAKGMEKKKQDYYHNWIFVINVYNLEGNWQEYVLNKIKEVSEHRLMKVNAAITKCAELYPHKEIEHKQGEHRHPSRRHARGGRPMHRGPRHNAPAHHHHPQHQGQHAHPHHEHAQPGHVHHAVTSNVAVHHVAPKVPQAPPVLAAGPSKKIEVPHVVHHAEPAKPEAEKTFKKRIVRPVKEEEKPKKAVKKKEPAKKAPVKKKGILGIFK